MRKKPPHEKETLTGISGRVVAPPSSADERPDSSDRFSSARRENGSSKTELDEVESLSTSEESDGWTIERLKRRSSIPSALPSSQNPRENAFRISDTRTLNGLPRV